MFSLSSAEYKCVERKKNQAFCFGFVFLFIGYTEIFEEKDCIDVWGNPVPPFLSRAFIGSHSKLLLEEVYLKPSKEEKRKILADEQP